MQAPILSALLLVATGDGAVDAQAPAGWQPVPAARVEAAPRPVEGPRPVEAPRPADGPDALEALKSAAAARPEDVEVALQLAYALGEVGARREAEAQYRRALSLDPRRWTAYAEVADLVAQAPDRWQRRAEIVAFLERAQAAARGDDRAHQQLALALARFERSVGLLAEARRRLEPLVRADVPPIVRNRARALVAAIAGDERALALADWPEVALPPEAQARLRVAEQELDGGRASASLVHASALIEHFPGSTAVRFLRARSLEAVGRPDEATRELTLVVRLRPSHAEGWRLLGELLARNGGPLTAQRADEALRRALALEPSWTDLRELRRRVRERPAPTGKARVTPERPPISPQAQALYADAQRWMASETPEQARSVLEQALADSPGFVDAAVALFELGGVVAPATVNALWRDPDGLTRLASEILRVRQDPETAEAARGWLDRAVALGAGEARFQRALLRAELADPEGALADLSAYLASDLDPPRLAEAQALRRTLEPAAPGDDAAVAVARQHLLADRPREAVRALGGPCRAGLGAAALVELGRIAEYEERPAEALACHRLALGAAGGADAGPALERIARVAVVLPVAQLRAVEADLARGRAAGIPVAAWALARLAAEEQRWAAAADQAEAFASRAPATDPLRAEASRAATAWRRRSDEQRQQRALGVRLAVAAAGLVVVVGVGLLLARRLRGRTVAAALGRSADLYPEVAAVVAELRHDLLKHRASALGMIGVSVTAREEIARALREPTPASAVVAAGYERLRRAGAAAGVNLRVLSREPVFGPLARALARAEAIVDRPGTGAELAELDRLLREQHGPALAALLTLVPRTRLEPSRIAGWVRDLVEASDTGAVTPGLQLPAADIEVPMPREALHTIVANLTRNALGALRGAPEPRLMLRVEQHRDVAGVQLVTVLVADSSAATVSLDQIEQRDGQRGLGIVRDLVRRWGGHLVVREEAAPFVKAIGAAFPAAGRGERAP